MAAQEPQYSGAKSEVRTSALCLAFLLGGGGGEGGGGLPHLPADVGKPPFPADSVGLCQLPKMEEHGQLLEDNPSPPSPEGPHAREFPRQAQGPQCQWRGPAAALAPKGKKNCLLWQPLLCPSQLPLCCLICSSPRTKEAAGSVGLDATD